MKERSAKITGWVLQGVALGTLLFAVVCKLYYSAQDVLYFRYQGF